MTAIKMKYGNDIRRVNLDRLPSYEELRRVVRQTYALQSEFVLKCEDEEFDVLTVSGDDEVKRAAAHAAKTSGVLRFEIIDAGDREILRVSGPMNLSTSQGLSPLSSSQMLHQMFDLEPLKRQSHAEISEFMDKVKTTGHVHATQEQLDQLVRSLQTMIAESSVMLKQSSGEAMQICEAADANLKISQPMEQCARNNRQHHAKYSSQLVKNTASDCTNVMPHKIFIKTWRLKNNGARSWPPLCSLSFVDGSSFSSVEVPIFSEVFPEQQIDISVEMMSPSTPGKYQGFWSLRTPDGTYFGEKICCDVMVNPVTPPPLPTFVSEGPAHLMEAQMNILKLTLDADLKNAQGTNTPMRDSERDSIQMLQSMGFRGDLVNIFRKNGGSIAETINQLIVE